MKELLQRLLDDIANTEKGLTDLDLREIYSAVHDIGYAERERQILASVRASLARLYDEAGIEAAASGLVEDNAMASVWWKFAYDYITSRKK